MTRHLIPFAAAGALMLMALAQSSPGTPLPNILVGLEPQSGGPALTATTAGSNAEAGINVPPGIYSVFVANGASLTGPATMTVIEGQQQRTSGVISRTPGRAYAPNTTGPGRMMINTAQSLLVRIRLTAVQPPAPSRCLTLPNGSPRFVTAQGSASGSGAIANNQAMSAARTSWSLQARAFNAPGQPDYADWSRAAQTNVGSSVGGSPFARTTTVTLTGQPCHRP